MSFWKTINRIWNDDSLLILLVCILFAVLTIAGIFSAEAGA